MNIVSDYLLLKPNWVDPVSYKRKWQTNIQTGLKGSEQRSALFTWPRRSLSYSILSLNYSKTASLKRVLYKNMHNLLGIPFWQDGTVLSSQAAFGQKVLNVRSTINRNFEVGGLCVLVNSEVNFEDGIIDVMSSTQITLHSNLAHTWPIGTEVYPAMISRIQPSQQIDMATSLYGKMKIDAEEDYYAGIVRHIGGDESFSFYKGSRVFDCQPNWSSELNYKLYHPYERLAFLGKTFSMTHYDETAIGLNVPYTKFNKASIQKIIDFFDSRKGRWGNFWMPTWQNDMIVTAPFLASDNILNIRTMDFSSYWLAGAMGSYIIIFWPDWTFACGKVVDATATTITLESVIGKKCVANQRSHLLVCFLLCSRFDQDEIEVGYLTSEVANVSLSSRALFDEVSVMES